MSEKRSPQERHREEFDAVVIGREIKYPLTLFEGFIIIFKGALHASILLLPWSFTKIGHVFGQIFLILLYMIVWICISLLVGCAHILTRRRGAPVLNYGDVAQYSLLDRYPNKEKAALGFRIFVDVILFLALFICSIIYLINAANLIEPNVGDECVRVWLIMLILGWILVILAFLCYLKWIVWLCALGVICLLAAIVICIVFFYSLQIVKSRDDDALVKNLGTYPIFLGVVPFTVHWIYLILPIENDTKNPAYVVESYCSPWLIVGIIVTLGHMLFGFLGYDIFGPMAQVNVVMEAGPNKSYVYIMMLFALGMFFTINLLMLIASKIIWHYIEAKINEKYQLVIEILLAPICVLVMILCALLFNLFMVAATMLATLTVSLISFIFPVVFDFLMNPEPTRTVFKVMRYIRNVGVLVIGIIIMFCGFWADWSIWDVRQNSKSEHKTHYCEK